MLKVQSQFVAGSHIVPDYALFCTRLVWLRLASKLQLRFNRVIRFDNFVMCWPRRASAACTAVSLPSALACMFCSIVLILLLSCVLIRAALCFVSIPAQMLYVTSFEWCKQQLAQTRYEPYRHLIAGFASSIVSNIVTTPVDVVSQRQMVVQGDGGGKRFVSGREIARRIVAVNGVRGLYRGFFVSVLTYAPTSALWWTVRWHLLPPSLSFSLCLCVCCLCGVALCAHASHRRTYHPPRLSCRARSHQQRTSTVALVCWALRCSGSVCSDHQSNGRRTDRCRFVVCCRSLRERIVLIRDLLLLLLLCRCWTARCGIILCAVA